MEELIVVCEESFRDIGISRVAGDQFSDEGSSSDIMCDLLEDAPAGSCLDFRRELASFDQLAHSCEHDLAFVQLLPETLIGGYIIPCPVSTLVRRRSHLSLF